MDGESNGSLCVDKSSGEREMTFSVSSSVFCEEDFLLGSVGGNRWIVPLPNNDNCIYLLVVAAVLFFLFWGGKGKGKLFV